MIINVVTYLSVNKWDNLYINFVYVSSVSQMLGDIMNTDKLIRDLSFPDPDTPGDLFWFQAAQQTLNSGAVEE